MRIRQMGFSSRLKAHRKILTLETLKYIVEYLEDGNPRAAALRSGVPASHASRQGSWLKKHPIVLAAQANEIDKRAERQLKKAILEIENQMTLCKSILGLEDY